MCFFKLLLLFISYSFPDVLELYSEKSWSLPDDIVMIPSEQAAIVAFNDPKGFSLTLTCNVLPTVICVFFFTTNI